ncbi:hypothetical protein Ancab_027758 [Ancistrocladus abbreviatus]
MEKSGWLGYGKGEALLRLLAVCVLILTSCLIRTNTQTKLLFGVLSERATFKDIDIFVISVYINLAVAGYNLLQFIRCLTICFYQHPPATKLTVFSNTLHWLFFLLDQVTVYLVFATNCAAASVAMLAVTGSKNMQWMKLCNIYTRFCYQAGGHIFCGCVASILLASVSSISAFNLFSFYSPKQFMSLKRQIKIKIPLYLYTRKSRLN